ncbi:MAG: polyketide synthase, partial [Deltaproteobacteria bacterium]|nr:polyketide synthase [Deltaproteobacteria bacterium]
MPVKKNNTDKKLHSRLQEIPIAIIGMSAIFPQSKNLQDYWDNIVKEINCITDVPPSRWNIEDYYDPDPTAEDKTYCKRGGFIPDIDFDPLEFGLPPNILEVTDVHQLLSLITAKQLMKDGGYVDASDKVRENTGVILGVGGGQKLMVPLISRLQYPIWEKVLKNSGVSDQDTGIIVEKIKKAYVGWEENSFPGALGNIVAGRIANRLNLGGTNCVVDAACASSFSGIRMAINELLDYRADMMITGGVDTDNSPYMFLCFSKTQAFSPDENSQPFDVNSSGMI